MLCCVEHEKDFITFGPGYKVLRGHVNYSINPRSTLIVCKLLHLKATQTILLNFTRVLKDNDQTSF